MRGVPRTFKYPGTRAASRRPRWGGNLGEWIESICTSSVNIVRAHMKPAPKSSRRRRDRWTPTYHLQMKMHDTFLKIRQFLTGQGGRVQWEQWYAPIGVKKEIDRLRTFAIRELRDHEKRDKVMMLTCATQPSG